MKKIALLLLLIISVMVISFADEKGGMLAKKFFDLAEADTISSDSSLIIIDSKGNKRIRQIVRYSRVKNDTTDSYIEFQAPADVEGTKFLTVSKKGKDDEQRLYLPALGKIRRISSSDKGASFMGTDLSYYDLETHDLEDFTYKDLGTDTVNKKPVFVLEMTPIDKDAPYSKQIMYLDQEIYFPIQIDNYDEEGKLLKKIYNVKISNIDGVYVSERMIVDNIQDKQKTLLDVKNIKINKKIPESVFSIQNLTK